MSAHCEVCKKAPSSGVKYVRRGLAKAKGGVGRKVTGKTKRWFHPNVQRIRVIDPNGHVHRAWVCAKCIRGNKVTKAPNQNLQRKHREMIAEAKAKS